MKAIPTRYLGYYFRSRLEARWAVFIERLQLKWRYEPEGFNLPSGPYLPDFLLEIFDGEGRGMWVEIKPFAPSEKELALLCELSEATDQPAYIVYGEPWPSRFKWLLARPDSTSLVEPDANNTGFGGYPSDWMLCERDRDMGFSVDPADAFRYARAMRFEHKDERGLPLGWENIDPVMGDIVDSFDSDAA